MIRKSIQIDLQRKIQIYENILRYFESISKQCSIGFCQTILMKTYSEPNPFHLGVMKEYYPEIYKYKPRKIRPDGYWFNPRDHELRIKILKEVIQNLTSVTQ